MRATEVYKRSTRQARAEDKLSRRNWRHH